MRLGGYSHRAETIAELDALGPQLDEIGLSAIPAPSGLIRDGSSDACAAFGECAGRLGVVIGEAGMWENLLTADALLRERRIARVRTMLVNADRMGCRCVVSLVGSRHPSDRPLAIHSGNYGAEAAAAFREIVLRILDGLDLRRTRYVIEPWHNTFFAEPEGIRAFLDSVGHPALGLHLDQMNLVSQSTYIDTTALIHRTFDLLADRIVAVHLKDIAQDLDHMFLKLDEVPIGDGVLDYHAYLSRIAELPADTPCFCEHLAEQRLYLRSYARLHRLAEESGTAFVRRRPRSEPC